MSYARGDLLVNLILSVLDSDVPLVPLETPYEWLSRKRKIKRAQYRDSLKGLRSRRVLDIIKKDNTEFIKLTKKGVLKVLLAKAQIKVTDHWDRKWRVLVFDIPEDFHSVRDRFRKLLKQNHFIKLQASVFISPYPLNRDAVSYLQEAGLMGYIRIMKVEEMDNDKDLRRKFNLV
jgi:CRISPR-associated endonuclease Cas2